MTKISNSTNAGQNGDPSEREKVDDEKQLDLHIADTAASLKKLEGLFGKLDNKMKNLKSDLESKFERFANAHEKRLEHLENAQQEMNQNLQV